MSDIGFRSIGFELSGSANYTICPGSLFATSANTLVLCPGIITSIELETGGTFEFEVHDYFDAAGKIIRGGPLTKEGELQVTGRAAVRGGIHECYGTNKPAAFTPNNMLLNAEPAGSAPRLYEGEWHCRHGMAITLTSGGAAACRLGITYLPTLSAGLRKRQNDRGAVTENYLRPNLV